MFNDTPAQKLKSNMYILNIHEVISKVSYYLQNDTQECSRNINIHESNSCRFAKTRTGIRKWTGKKKLFYLMTHSTRSIYSYIASDLDSERGNPMSPLHGLLFPINSRTWFMERSVLFNDALNTFYFSVIWRRTYGKIPLR